MIDEAKNLADRRLTYIQAYAETEVQSGTSVDIAIRRATDAWNRRIAAEMAVADALNKEERNNG